MQAYCFRFYFLFVTVLILAGMVFAVVRDCQKVPRRSRRSRVQQDGLPQRGRLSCHAAACHVMRGEITSRRVTPCHAQSWHVILILDTDLDTVATCTSPSTRSSTPRARNTVPSWLADWLNNPHFPLRHALSCHVMSSHLISHHVMARCCHVTLRHGMSGFMSGLVSCQG